jgi:hypothetical protein
VDPVPDPLFHRKSGSAGIRTQISGSANRYWTRPQRQSRKLEMSIKFLDSFATALYLRPSQICFKYNIGFNWCLQCLQRIFS